MQAKLQFVATFDKPGSACIQHTTPHTPPLNGLARRVLTPSPRSFACSFIFFPFFRIGSYGAVIGRSTKFHAGVTYRASLRPQKKKRRDAALSNLPLLRLAREERGS